MLPDISAATSRNRKELKEPTIREKPDGMIVVENVAEEDVKTAEDMLGCVCMRCYVLCKFCVLVM